MFNRIITWSLENRLLILVLTLLMVVTGWSALRRLPIDAFLDTTLVQVQINTVATGLGEVYHYLVTGQGKSLKELTTIHDWQVKPRLRSVPGVAEVNTWGGQRKQYHVIVDEKGSGFPARRRRRARLFAQWSAAKPGQTLRVHPAVAGTSFGKRAVAHVTLLRGRVKQNSITGRSFSSVGLG